MSKKFASNSRWKNSWNMIKLLLALFWRRLFRTSSELLLTLQNFFVWLVRTSSGIVLIGWFLLALFWLLLALFWLVDFFWHCFDWLRKTPQLNLWKIILRKGAGVMWGGRYIKRKGYFKDYAWLKRGAGFKIWRKMWIFPK